MWRSEIENSLFSLYFFNKDISFNIPWKFLIFDIHVHDGHSEGSVSRIFYLGPSFYFMQSRKEKFLKNEQKLPVFWHKIKTKDWIKNLRHASLGKDVVIIYAKFHDCEVNIK